MCLLPELCQSVSHVSFQGKDPGLISLRLCLLSRLIVLVFMCFACPIWLCTWCNAKAYMPGAKQRALPHNHMSTVNIYRPQEMISKYSLPLSASLSDLMSAKSLRVISRNWRNRPPCRWVALIRTYRELNKREHSKNRRIKSRTRHALTQINLKFPWPFTKTRKKKQKKPGKQWQQKTREAWWRRG